MTLITATDLTCRYGRRTVLSGLGLTLAAGEMVGLIGPNGAGKSTALRCLAGLQRPQAGCILLAGEDLDRMAPRRRARLLGYLAQDAQVHWPLTVDRLVSLGRLPHLEPWSRPASADRAAIDRAMGACGVADLRDRPVTTLSGGERARALLARVLAAEPAVVLADEPVAGLDPYHQLQVMELLRSSADAGTAVLMVLHDLTLAARFCTRAVLLDEGRAVADGPVADVLRPDLLERTYGVRMAEARMADGSVLHLPWTRAGGTGGDRA